jgi:hypothetical protein
MTTSPKTSRKVELSDLLAQPIDRRLAPDAPPVSPEEAEARIRGMARLAYPRHSAGELAVETDKILKEYRKAGSALARLLRGFIIGEVQQRRRKPNEAENWRRFVHWVRVRRMTPAERDAAWRDFADRRPAGKRGEPTNDEYVLAALVAGDNANMEAAYRETIRRCQKDGWVESDVPPASVADAYGLPPAPPVSKRT